MNKSLTSLRLYCLKYRKEKRQMILLLAASHFLVCGRVFYFIIKCPKNNFRIHTEIKFEMFAKTLKVEEKKN